MPVANVIECSRLAIGLLSLGQQRAQIRNSHGVRTSAPQLSKGVSACCAKICHSLASGVQIGVHAVKHQVAPEAQSWTAPVPCLYHPHEYLHSDLIVPW